MDVGIVGATGQVGRVMLSLLDERSFPVSNLRLFSSSSGRTLDWKGQSVVVEDASAADFRGLDLCLFSAGSFASKALAEKVVDGGALVIDNSSAWRDDPNVPLVVAEVNAEALDGIPKGIVANPNCTTMIATLPLHCLNREAGLEAMTISTYQAVSGVGQAGVDELQKQMLQAGKNTTLVTHCGQKIIWPISDLFPDAIACNVIPFVGQTVDDGSGETDEEQKLTYESRKILGLPDLTVAATCVRVPVYCGHSLSISAAFARPITPNRAIELLYDMFCVELSEIPMPLQAAGSDLCYVGRVRRDPTRTNGLSFFVVGDNLRKGAALNAVQIAEGMLSRGILPST